MSARGRAQRFARIELVTPDPAEAEALAAEAYEAGAVGLEEREGAAGGTALWLYAPLVRGEAVAEAVRARAGPRARVAGPEPVASEDWSETWKAGLAAIRVSPRLLIRPSFALAPAGAGAELVIDPGQAFGTGSHASTALALAWIDALAPGLAPGARILDVGCGSGVLALAALRLSEATRAVALDLDPLAAEACRANAARNALAPRVDVLLGPLAALRGARFALVVANLLRSELLPLLDPLARALAPGGHAVLSGVLEGERD